MMLIIGQAHVKSESNYHKHSVLLKLQHTFAQIPDFTDNSLNVYSTTK